MGKVVLYIAQSLDGYISRENGDIDWLRDDQDYGFDTFFESVNTVIMGRKTYEHIFELAEEFPYKNKDVYVVSRMKEGYDEYATYIQPEQISPLIEVLKNDQDKTIWLVGGAQLIYLFISLDLIDEFQIAIQPTLIGNGIPLFEKNEMEQQLDLTDVKKFDDGMLILTYRRHQ
ncbi:dihydrofolate reductase family protein [Halobacillus yeomjeoni]|uniref:Dihydrofolate reductase n=1 Tax=Halobacillus yeomjeoni TaxID=311194 RepID=A0A931MTP5_9BACI|nr:dihydrofolate reductase family protein [Halobacillus yeomjeoni]MBH0228661.1 dihydrofolate reductase [Halobacillus yeomjeoni]